jgi:hypothetical protein
VEVPPVQEQLIVFARELGELYRLERSRNAELDGRIEELKMAILHHLAADHNDGSADDLLRDALRGSADD